MKRIISTIGRVSEQIKTGKTPPTKVSDYFDGEVPWFTPGDFKESMILQGSNRTISDKALQDKKAVIFDKNTVLITCIGEIGKVGLISEQSSCNQQITGIKLKDYIYPKFFAYWCKAHKKLLEGQASNAVVPILNNAVLSKIKFDFPESIDDQKRIAYLLGKVEGLIAQRKQHLQHLDDLLKSVFLEMFGDSVRNEKGWEKRRISEFARVKIGPFGSLLHAEDYISGGIPSINPSHIVDGEIEIDDSSTITEEKFKKLSQYRLDLNDVIVARRGEIGRCALVRTDSKMLCGTGSMFIRITSNYSPTLLQFMIFRTPLKSFLEGQAKGVTMKNLNSSILENMEVINPPTYLQKQFANIVEKVEGIKSRYQASLTDLETLYSALSQKAFKGELDLSRVPLPPDDPEAIAAPPATHEPPHTADTFHLPAPSDLATLNSPEGRTALLDHWLTLWLERLNNTSFSTQPFIDAAQQRLWELAEQDGELAEEDALELGAADYDYVRSWISESLEMRHLAQTYNDDKNRVQLKAVSHR